MSNALQTSPNLVEALRVQADQFADRQILRFLGDQEGDETCVTYAQLDLRARAIAARLQAADGRGERALVLHPPGIDYVAALFGCFYAGVVAVPAYPPRMNRSVDRLRDIALDAQARFGLTTSGALARLDRQQQNPSELTALQWIATDECLPSMAADWRAHTPHCDDVALLQYTSGSTSAPKGVVLSHANFLHNMRSLAQLRDASIEDHFVSWLPPYHDMGLVGATLLPLCMGTMATLLSPTTFLQRPLRWLSAITRYGGTISGGPNFAYELCCRRISEAQRATLDLRSWRVAFSGAERVRAATLERFTATFEPNGFRRSVFAPCYGLAEATLGVSFTALDALPTIARIDEQALGKGHAVDSEVADGSRTLVSCGKALPNCEVRIVDPQSLHPVADDTVGELWVRSPSVATSYWGKPALSEAVFHARLASASKDDQRTWLRTGDLGFMRAGEIFVAGRIKDLIVIRGVNYYPEDIEAAIESCHPRLRAGCGVAFSIDVQGEERLVIVHEVDSLRDLTPAPIMAAIQSAVAEQQQLQIYDVLLVEPGSVPKTSSGKLQRNHCRELYQSQQLPIVERSGPPAQVTTESSRVTEQVAELMATILGLDKVAPDDDFFWLGGHSLLATQLISRVRDIFAVDVSLRTAFEASTPRTLAARIAVAPVLTQRGPTQRVDRNGHLPLSFSQERMWLLHQLDPKGTAYNVAGACLIEGQLDLAALRASLNEVLQQHEVLRTNYRRVEGKPALHIAASATLKVELIDLSQRTDPLAAARTHASAFAAQPFDIAAELLVRAVVYRTGPQTHVVAVCMHHLVTDAWSLGLFVADMLKFYDVFAAGATPVRPTPALTYVDYAHWQREYLTDTQLAPQLAYWKNLLAGAEAIELPTDRPRASRRSSAGALEPLPLSAEFLDSLTAFAAAEGTTLFMVMLAAFEVLLNRYTHRSDLVVGVPVANRNWLASETLMGTLVNTLALRVKFDPQRSFRTLLQQIREVALDAYSHQDLPFERLVSALPVERRLGESPLIRVMFDFQNAPMPTAAGPLAMRPVMISRHASQFDLSLLILDTDFGRIASVEYSAELFDAETIRRFLGHYVSILECITLHPDTAVSHIPLLKAEERKHLLAHANPTSVLDTSAGALPGYAEHLARMPQAPAVIDQQGTFSYQELDHAATRLAHRLRALGAGRGQRVAICLDRNRQLVVAMLAVLKSGAAYVPLDARHPAERVTMVLHDADVRVVLTESHLKDKLNIPAAASVVCIDETQQAAANDEAELPLDIAVHEAAYLIYTSGSTGRPKGVEVSRGALANFLASMRHTPGIKAADRLLSVTTVAFDIAGLELFLPLVSGACVYVASNEVVADGRALLNLMTNYRPTFMQATPATWKMLLDVGWNGDTRLKVLCGGEALSRELASKLLSHCESLWNMYGPTETTIWSTVHRVTADDTGATVAIGKPIDATSIYILDTHGQLVPQGVSGEIYIGGAGVANGYFRNPQLTAERFVADPFAGSTAARMYRTGDAGRWRSDLTLEYLGRLDHQIKLRGFRIEPAEIEIAIKTNPRVRDALVIAREFAPGDQRLVAYCLVSTVDLNDTALSAELTEALSRKLPSYMIPSAFVALSAFPQTPNGKIDRAALPAPALEQRALDEQYVAPRDEVEATLQALWQEILGIPRVGIRDNFFMLGGHSLLATVLFANIERTFAVQLQLSILFERSTIEYLAERIRTERQAQAAGLPAEAASNAKRFTHLVPIQEQGTRPRLFCVHGAGGHVLNFWGMSQHLGPDQPFYALQAPGVDGKRSPYEDIEAMAVAYLEELRAVQPRGPYYLSGYCGGGWIAFEMANRLRDAGEQVALLALLDSYGPNMNRTEPRVDRWVQGTLRDGLSFIMHKISSRLRRDYETLSQAIRIKYYRWSGRVVPYELRDVWLTQTFLDAAASYRPSSYDGQVTLVLAKDVTAPSGAAESQFGWAGLTPAGIQVFHVPGTHHTLTNNPNVAALAATLARCMAAAENTAHYTR